jgi:isopentenyl-diphosphate delta-isomerase
MFKRNSKIVKVILVNRKDRVTGYKEKYEAHRNPVHLHRAISVVILDKSGKKMLLQKRAQGKPTWPLFWTNACCTHPGKGESYLGCAKRRLKEEMGILTPLKESFRFIYKAKYDKVWGENEYDVVFIGKYSGEVKPDPEEVVDYKWILLRDLVKDIRETPGKFTPWLKRILQKRIWF